MKDTQNASPGLSILFFDLPIDAILLLDGGTSQTRPKPAPGALLGLASSVAGFRLPRSDSKGVHCISWKSDSDASESRHIEASGLWVFDRDEAPDLRVEVFDSRTGDFLTESFASGHKKLRRMVLSDSEVLGNVLEEQKVDLEPAKRFTALTSLLRPELVTRVFPGLSKRFAALTSSLSPELVSSVFPSLRTPRYATFERRERSVAGIDTRFSVINVAVAAAKDDQLFDRTKVVEELLRTQFGGSEDPDKAFEKLLAEFQLAFASFFYLHSFDGFEQWVRLFGLFASCVRLPIEHPAFYTSLISRHLTHQFEALAIKFRTTDVERKLAGNPPSGSPTPTFPVHDLHRLSLSLLSSETMPTSPPHIEMQLAAQKFFEGLRKTFRWEFGDAVLEVLDARLEGPSVDWEESRGALFEMDGGRKRNVREVSTAEGTVEKKAKKVAVKVEIDEEKEKNGLEKPASPEDEVEEDAEDGVDGLEDAFG